MALPPRTANTMSDAIALSSPNGRLSGRAKAAAMKKLSNDLFGPNGLQHPGLPPQPQKSESLRRSAATLLDLAERGMRPRAGRRDAAAMLAEADALEAQGL
jgi:hypothetical protein